jgi:hypothetical protein
MKVGLTLHPGDRGTRKLVSEYGDKLVCVRYRYDKVRRRRLKTIETIVEEIPWIPKPGKDDPVFLRIRWNEKGLQTKIKNAGGKWNKDKKVWILSYGEVNKLELLDRVVE